MIYYRVWTATYHTTCRIEQTGSNGVNRLVRREGTTIAAPTIALFHHMRILCDGLLNPQQVGQTRRAESVGGNEASRITAWICGAGHDNLALIYLILRACCVRQVCKVGGYPRTGLEWDHMLLRPHFIIE